ncbi:MAG: SusC/RagA family TonB-linked outer membrane protein [Phocaeicola sp.]
MNMKQCLALVVTMLCLCANAQTLKVTGIVRDKSDVIIGASIMVKDGTVGTVTNLDGEYSINVSTDATLVFSFIGYSPIEKKVAGQSKIDVILSDNIQSIDEVVVTAIGIKQQKKKLGYTTQEVNTEALSQPGTVNVGNALSGQIAGLTVNNPTGIFQAPSFSLRGKAPLMVIDGVPLESDLFDISPENIENINVLKGTAAAALYGSRGKDGAILITTKMAKTEGLTVSAGLSSMVSAGFTVFPETQSEFGSGSNGQYAFWDGADGGISDGDMTWGPRFDGQMIAQWNSPIRNKATGETIPWWGDVSGTAYDDQALYERVPIAWESHDNLRDFLNTGVITKATFAIANKSKKASYNFNGDFASQKGQVPNTNVYTGGLNFNSMYNLSNAVTLSANLSYNKVYSPNYPRYGYGPKNHMYTILLWMGNDVNGKELAQHYYRPDAEGIRQANYNYAWYNNPYFAANELTQKHDRNTINGRVRLNWDILPGLTLQGRLAGHIENCFEDMQVPKSYMNYGDSRNGDYKTWNTSQLDVNADLLATYTRALNRDFAFTINAGSSLYYRQIRKENQATDGLIVSQVYNLGNSLNPVKATNSLNEKAIESAYASVNLDLFNALFLTFTGRNDWSSTLSRGNNSYFYPSISASTLVNEYVKMPSWMDYLKINGAWAQVSSDLDPYSLYATYGNSTIYGSTPSVTYPSSLLNANILPQKTTSYEVGLSSSFLRNRLGLELTYYHMIDENSIIQLPISASSGFTQRYVNGNVYTTNGLEFILSATPIKNRDFTWSFSTNWSTNIRKLSEIYGGQDKFGNYSVGDRADAIYATEWEKTPNGELILDTNTGMPTRSAFQTNIGNSNSDVRFGLQNSFKIKGFTVNVDIDGAIGGTMISTTIQKMWWGGKHPNSTIYRQEEYDNGGKAIYVPKGVNIVSGSVSYDVNGNIVSDTRVYQENQTAVNIQTWAQNYPYRAVVTTNEDKLFANTFSRSFLKLRRIAVSYDLAKIINSTHIKGLDVTLFGNNLAVLKKTPYLDPDFGSSDGDLQDPSARYVGISANIKF